MVGLLVFIAALLIVQHERDSVEKVGWFLVVFN